MRMITRKSVVVVTGTVLVLVVAAVAYAYWTAGGSGTGTAETGTSADVVVVQTSTIDDMGPGVAPQTLSGTFNNPNDGPIYVSTVTVSIASVDKAAGAPAGTCDATDYTLTGAAMAVNAEVPPGTGQGSWSGATIAFNNKPTVNQDACKLATVNLAYSVG